MACSRALSFPFSYDSCIQLSSNRNSRAVLRTTLHLAALSQDLRRCCCSQKPKETLLVSCALKSIPGFQDGDSLASEAACSTLVKLSGGDMSCQPGGNSCSDVAGLGLPLPEVGACAGQGIPVSPMALLGCLGTRSTFLKLVGVDLSQQLLLGIISAVAGGSVYLTCTLSTMLDGVSCAYGVASVLLSFGLLLLVALQLGGSYPAGLQAWIANCFSSKKVKQAAGLHLAMSVLVVLAFSSTYTGIALALNVSTDMDLPPVEPKVTTSSRSLNVSLAKHLQSVGAKMYGAFWCSHCYEQKQMFGREAIKYLNYVECYPEGYRKGVQIAKACDAANIKGFPTWIIKGEVLSGEQELSELARVAGFDGFHSSK